MKASQGRFGLAMLAALVLLPCIACGGHDTPTDTTTFIYLSIDSYVAEMDQGATRQFTSLVQGTSNTVVVWSIQEGASGGNISSQGLYTAPFKAGIYHVVATSAQDSSKRAVAEIIVHSVNISISPPLGDMEPGEIQQFSATVTGTVVPEVTWSVANDSNCGSITSSGFYTAPPSQNTCSVVAANTKDTSATNSATVIVTSILVEISPPLTAIKAGATRQFRASVAGTLDDAVSWSVQEGAAGGTISELGLYTAPSQLGQYHVIASSLSHPGAIGIASVAIVTSNFSATGSLSTARGDATATLLPSGEVLIVGGYSYEAWESHASAEIYDPSTGTFRTTGTMATARDGHTATLLANGKVLIAGGGITEWVSFKSAEIYDPTTGIFTPTADMTSRRTHHTATRLQNGKVLIVGGVDWVGDTNSTAAELYDPETGTFSPAGTLAESRWDHTATLLDDNRVLIIGGDVDYYTHASALVQIYDPQTTTFAGVATMDDARAAHQSTRLSGNSVLVTGGYAYTAAEGEHIFDDALIFDTSLLTFKPSTDMTSPRWGHSSTILPNGQVLITGGYTGTQEEGWWNGTDTAELYDTATSKFIAIGPMENARTRHTATLLHDGRVLIVGGCADKVAELYNP